MPDSMLKTTKQELRKQYRVIRNALSDEVRRRESRNVCEQLTESCRYREADAVFCYVSYGSELETDLLIQKALSDGKNVAVPVIKGNEMIFSRISVDTEYRLNRYGIPEPVEEELAEPEKYTSVLMVLPGLCYDSYGGRIGYGGGYYDRYIAKHGNNPKLLTVSLALSCQFFDGCIPMEEHDIRPDEIIYPSSIGF